MEAEESWTRSLSSEQRRRLGELHRLDRRKSAERILTYLALWAVAGALAVHCSTLWVRLPAWLLMGFCLHGLGDFMHMCSHGRVFGWGWVDRLVGFLCGAPVFMSCSNYRANHLLHHRYLNTAQDPDYFPDLANRKLRAAMYIAWMLVGLAPYAIRLIFTGPLNAANRLERALCILETLTLLSLHSWLIALAQRQEWMPVLVNAWLMGVPFALVIASIRGLAEHTLLDFGPPPDPLHGTRTTLSNRLVSFFFNNQNYHLEHHLFPSMPWHSLDEAHRLLKPLYEEREASVAGSYLRYVRDVFHHGPNAQLRYRDGESYLPET